ncbi:MAG: glutathione-regulated potassium-efflux system protein KefB [Gammaproteobacteria bacterium]|nr:glutathione-regulated potassium-efflux system protein KefB [Gammaproteobacteria bacterium]
MNLLFETTILLLAAALAAPFGKVSRIGSVLAFVGIGVLIGPWCLGLIRESEHILNFAEIGVVFLLFIIGLELQPKRLWALRTLIFGAGTLQLVVTACMIFVTILVVTDFSWQSALVIAYGLGLSSTAFALRLLADNQELQSAQGKLAFGVLLFQDLAVIPLLAIIPMLAVVEPALDEHAVQIPLWGAIVAFTVFVLIGHFLLIPFLRLVAWTRVHEAFTATALLLVIGSALIMQQIGLSMGLGAFLAGVLVADSEYRHQLEADIDPFKGLLLGLFFMAVGMSTNIGILTEEFIAILTGVIGLIIVKTLLLFILGRLHQLNNVNAARFAAYLCQGGEFGFVAFTLASSFAIISAETKDMLIVIVTISMALTPAVLKLVSLLFRNPGMDAKQLAELSITAEENNQIIIAGYGRFGQILGRVLNAQDIRYTAIDINPEQVKLVREFGNKVYYGDAAKHALLETAGVAKAGIFALCIDDVEASIVIVKLLKAQYPAVKIFCRARNRFHELRLRELQVDYVIRETLFSGLEFTRAVLKGMGLETEKASNIVAAFQQQDVKLILQQAALPVNDKATFIQTTKEAAQELKNLLQDENKLKNQQ